ncbi:hypothetical protein ACFL3G_09965 [Planctomycetota bacterium]
MNWKYLKYDLEEKWERLEVRRRINDHSAVVKKMTIGSISILLIVILFLVWPESVTKPAATKKAWYYDLNTGKLFVAEADQNPPIKAPSGPLPNGELAGVLAHVYKSYHDKNAEPFIAFVEKLTDEAQKTRPVKLGPPEKRTEQEIKLWNTGRLIKRVDDDEWVSYSSPKGQNIIHHVVSNELARDKLFYCYPD